MSFPKELYSEKFAEYMDSIKILYLVDDSFKKICEEYATVKVDVKKIKKKIKKDFRERLKSENLCAELEEEILFYLIKTME